MLSIILPTYNEEKYLPNLLKSIKKQSYKDYEIIIADSSKDKTKLIAKKFKCKVVNGGYPPIARNNGAKISKHDLLFLDADVIFKNQNFLKKFLKKIKQNNLDIATCKVLIKYIILSRITVINTVLRNMYLVSVYLLQKNSLKI